MSFRTKTKFGSRENARLAGRRSQQVQSIRRMQDRDPPLRRPDAGTLIRTIIVVDHIAGTSTEIQVRQAERKNQVIPSVFGRVGNLVGWDRIMRRLRAICVCRWIEE